MVVSGHGPAAVFDGGVEGGDGERAVRGSGGGGVAEFAAGEGIDLAGFERGHVGVLVRAHVGDAGHVVGGRDQEGAAGDVGGAAGGADHVGVAAVGGERAVGRDDPGAVGDDAVLVDQADELEQAFLAGGFGDGADGVGAGEVGVGLDRRGIGGADEQGLAELDVAVGEGDPEAAVGARQAVVADGDAAAGDVDGGRAGGGQPDVGPLADRDAVEGEAGAIHGLERGEQVGLIAAVLSVALCSGVAVGAEADRLEEGEEAEVEGAAVDIGACAFGRGRGRCCRRRRDDSDRGAAEPAVVAGGGLGGGEEAALGQHRLAVGDDGDFEAAVFERAHGGADFDAVRVLRRPDDGGARADDGEQGQEGQRKCPGHCAPPLRVRGLDSRRGRYGISRCGGRRGRRSARRSRRSS